MNNNFEKRSIWLENRKVYMIEQNLLPHKYEIFISENYKKTCFAIKTMIVRGAGAIGAAGAFAMWQAANEAPKNNYNNFIEKAKEEIEATRPTARDLFSGVESVYEKAVISPEEALKAAQKFADKNAEAGKKIGKYGNSIIEDYTNILTHCNAGRLALVAHGSALAPIYEAHKSSKKLFVYVDETRPRNQGARLTAWELNEAGIRHAIIPDNAAAWYMSQGKINMVITGADRIATNGDTANKIGTLEKAIAAKEYGIPFYIAAPLSTFDKECKTGKEIPIEERDQNEVLYQKGQDKDGIIREVLVASPDSEALNPAFDVTPAKFITGYITEIGIITSEQIAEIFK